MTIRLHTAYDSPLMSAGLPESIDVWRAASAGRVYEGRVALARFSRLRPSLVDADGECGFRVAFERSADGQSLARVQASAELPLQCQRTLERFAYPVEIDQCLGLIRSESEEAGLLPEIEPVLVPDNGLLSPLDLIEDELILAVPVMPIRPDSEPVEQQFGADEATVDAVRPNPFAALAKLKSSS